MTSTQAAQHLGVTVSTIKRWADSGRLEHVKTAGGHRRFRKSALEKMRMDSNDFESTWIDLLTSNTQSYQVQSELLALRGRCENWCQVAIALGSVLVEIGLRWRAGTISIHEEHIASYRLSRALASCADAITVASDAGECVLVVPEHEEHTLGLSLLEPCVREQGWKPLWLGRKTPTPILINYIATEKPSVVAISASPHPQNRGHLDHIAKLLEQTCRDSRTELWFGGSGSWPNKPAYGLRLKNYTDILNRTV